MFNFCRYPNAHSSFVTFFVPPWFCTFAKACTIRDTLSEASREIRAHRLKVLLKNQGE